ncbi:MAG: ABC transporter ATP-binding protein [Thermotogota bacterium]
MINTVVVDDVKKSFVRKKKKLFKKSEKSFIEAVRGVSFEIREGEVFGLLGPNGAGKTTTIKMIAGLLKPTSGKVILNDLDVEKNPLESLRNIGTVLAGDRSVYWKLTARENLEYFAALYGFSKKEGKKRTEMILKKLGLTDRADEVVEKYSTGMKQKVALGKALMPDAPVVLLDEPTLGLDPQAALNLRETIIDLKKEGKTILITTHYMEEADFLSDRIAIIDNGEIIALDTPENLKKSLKEIKKIKITTDIFNDDLEEQVKKIEKIEHLAYMYDEESNRFNIVIHHNDGEELVQSIIELFNLNNIKLLSMNVKEPTLEDVFINMTGKTLRG